MPMTKGKIMTFHAIYFGFSLSQKSIFLILLILLPDSKANIVFCAKVEVSCPIES